MRELAINLAIGFLGLILLVLSKATIRYCITPRFLRIHWLGIPVRWVRLKNIRQVATQRVFWSERWSNIFSPTNRYLLIRKYSGLFKNLVITPKNHMVFKADLGRARDRLLSPSPSAGVPAHPGSEAPQMAVPHSAAR